MALEKITLLISDEGISAYEWDHDVVFGENKFLRDGMGIVQFGKYLNLHKNATFSILLNSIEEEYKLETMPHIPKRGTVLLRRNIDRYYRQNKYKFGIIQGREKFGKKDDQILLSSLANESIIEAWMQPILEKKISISAIYSLPITTENVVQKLGLNSSKLLVVTSDKAGLRLTYLNENKFKISRMVKTDKYEIHDIIQEIDTEIDKTLRYLGRIRLIFPDQKPDILIIGSSDICQAITSRENNNNTTGKWTICDATYLRSALTLDSSAVQNESVIVDLFIHILQRSKIKNHYANSDHTRYYRSRNLHLPLEIAAALFLTVLLLYSAVMYIDSQVLETKHEQLTKNIKAAESRLVMSKSKLPKYPVSADMVSSGVQSVQTLLVDRPNMKSALLSLSTTIEQYSNIQLDYLEWGMKKREIDSQQIEVEAPVVMEASAESEDTTELVDVDVFAETAKHWVQVITLRGRLTDFNGNYTSGNQSVDDLVNELNANSSFRSVIATQKPISPHPEKRITGVTGKQVRKGEYPEFSLEIIVDESKLS